MRRVSLLIAWNVLLTAVLFLAGDVIISNTRLIYRLVPEAYRIRNPVYHHTLAANLDGAKGLWGGQQSVIYTNSLGFKDSKVRQVKLRSDRASRVLIIGDSFTEGVGAPWEKTFVGLIQAHYPEIEVLNAAVSSYSPSIYRRKVAYFIENGYKFDHVIIYIDISDVQDEAIYDFESTGIFGYSEYFINTHAHVGDPPASIQHRHTFLAKIGRRIGEILQPNFRLSRYLLTQAEQAMRAYAADSSARGLVRSMWTVKGVDLPFGYGDLGVEGAIQKELREMDALTQVLRAHSVKFSVGVYPWPDQMAYDIVESRQVTVWRSWCERNGCAKFINHFPDFFALRSQPNWQDLVYIPGDFHFNEAGHQLVADRLIKEMRDIVDARR